MIFYLPLLANKNYNNMKKFFIAVCTLFMCANLMITAHGMLGNLTFQCEMIKPTKGIKGCPKAPVRYPSASINGHTLYINGGDGCVMQLLYGDDIVYSTVITDGVVELPKELTGNYKLQVIRGDYYFWAEIEL